MTIRSGIFNSVNGDRRYKAEDFAEYFATFIGNGVFPNPSNGFQVMANNDMTITLKAGKAWINGYYVTNDEDYIIPIDFADGVLNRIDRLVLQFNYANRNIVPIIKKGAFSSIPVAPSLKRDSDAYELALADIYVEKGTISIIQTNITDLRLDKDLCGMVHSTVDQVDTTSIFNQYQDWFNLYSQGKSADFEVWTQEQHRFFSDWFETIKGILNEDAAGNLQNQINTTITNIQSLSKIKTNITVLATGWRLNGTTNRYEYTITDSDITANSIVNVNIQLDSLDNAKMMLSACNSFDGFVVLYASSLLDNDIIVDCHIQSEVI